MLVVDHPVVPLDDERRFLLSLPVQALWGVGPRTTEKLHAARVRTIADVARMQPGELATLVGSGAAGHLHALASGHDPRPVRARPSRRSMGAQHALGRDERTPEGVEIVLLGLVDRVARRLRAAGRTAATVTLRVRFGDFTSSTASHTLPRPTAHTQVLLDATLQLLRGRHGEIARRGLTLVGFQASGLDDQGEQLLLPLTSATDPGLDTALDAVRDRFGARAVRRGVQLGRGERAPMPILPDQEDDA